MKWSKLLADFVKILNLIYIPIVLNVLRVVLMETQFLFTIRSEILAATMLIIHMSSQGKADSIEFYITFVEHLLLLSSL